MVVAGLVVGGVFLVRSQSDDSDGMESKGDGTKTSGKFATDGERAQSAASRSSANLKLARAHEGGRTVLVLNRQSTQALDPLGLTRNEFDTNPRQTSSVATQFNTRKSVSQTQIGLAWEQSLGNGQRI